MPRRVLLPLMLAVALAATLLPHSSAQGAARRPDLVVSGVAAKSWSVRAGAVLTVRVTTKNVGRARAGASVTRVYLSADARVGRDIAKASVKVKRLARGARQSASLRLRVPPGTPARTYRLIGCADTSKRVRESRERNNCRVATKRVTVTPAPVSPPPPPPPPGDFPKTPNPLSVAPDPDESRAVTKTAWPHLSETITATDAKGTTYSLTIPPGALVSREDITLTPLAAVAGLPLSGGLAAGVELKPHGLMLLEPATLTIDSPDLGPLAQQTPFYFHGQGEDFHLYPPLPPQPDDDANVVRMPILHFSTPGVGLGSPADRDAMSSYPPARLPGQIAADIAELLRQERERQENQQPPNPETGAEVVRLLTSFYYAVVKPRLEAAEANPRARGAAFAAIDTAYSWLRQMQLLGVGDDDEDATAEMQDAQARLHRVLEAVYKDAWQQCSQEHGLEGLPVLFHLGRMGQLAGFPWADDALQKFYDCSRFEVRFDSRVEYAGTWPVGGEELYQYPHTGAGSWHAKATATTEFSPTGGGITQAPLPLVEASYRSDYSFPRSDGTTCSGFSEQTGSVPGQLNTFVVPAVVNRREVPPGEEETWQEPDVELLITANPSRVQDTVRTVSCGGSDNTSTTSSRWQQAYQHFHGSQGILVGTKSDRSDDLMYVQTWENSRSEPNHLGGETWDETTVLEVWHKPVTGP